MRIRMRFRLRGLEAHRDSVQLTGIRCVLHEGVKMPFAELEEKRIWYEVNGQGESLVQLPGGLGTGNFSRVTLTAHELE